jgi:putative drug exporter of the RND superfamily
LRGPPGTSHSWRTEGSDTNSNDGRTAVDAVRATADGLPATDVGGQTALTIDWIDSVYGSFPSR